ncbi:hypothetical protein HNQ93_001743 [Hymenobacter luteus]|uniref:CHAD domain-containing protein n=2 Tax=Hymenobacter TaxID=89966 RepID=A0A7W9WCQ1_9BACT|nr:MULTISPECIES: hypothetical protein [Hymenobacter]MBB4600896.1 hypothetical protein [Hymenobacter latericoloratus]MBB6058897.1 hypothetical protein [Hymenobacter luteus]
MPSVALVAAPAAPVGVAPAPAPAPTMRQQLARTQSVLFDARHALYALRDEYPRQPARFARIRAAIQRLRQARAAYKAACEAFHASPEGEQLQRLRQQYARW